MKTYPLILGALAGLAAISTVVAADRVPATDARVEVAFSSPEKFADVGDGYPASEMGRTGILDQIRDFLVSRASAYYVADGQKLTVTFTEIDLAGDFEPWRSGNAMDIRIVRDIYPPRMDLEFKLTGPGGAVIKEGKRQLRDLAFMSNLSANRSDSLRYEKAMLEDWLRSEFPRS